MRPSAHLTTPHKITTTGMCIKLPVPATSHVLVKKQGYCGKLTYMRCVRACPRARMPVD